MVANHWSNDGMVTIHRYGLIKTLNAKDEIHGVQSWGLAYLQYFTQWKRSVIWRHIKTHVHICSSLASHSSNASRIGWTHMTFLSRKISTELFLTSQILLKENVQTLKTHDMFPFAGAIQKHGFTFLQIGWAHLTLSPSPDFCKSIYLSQAPRAMAV